MPETCDGTSVTCPADTVKASGTECRAAAAGGCDAAETCDGTSVTCPADTVKASGTECRAAAAGGCDVPETCDGTSVTCPADPGTGVVTAGKTCPAQIAALVDLYDSTGGAQWSDSTNWKSGDPCSPSATWFGVTCVTSTADGSYDVQ
jgi:hypothetical protein